jgi:dGTPase
MDKELKNCFGCLAEKKTRDEDARRRRSDAEDEDAYILNFGSPYAVDATQKILLSKALRRLSYKTQVLTVASNAHVRTRAIHTYEVASLSTLIARILGLNESLCQAIAFGHDIGHAPFGHLGEKFLSKVAGKNFRHEVFGVVIAQHIERKGKGLNLTRQVLEGILKHSRGSGDLAIDEKISQEANAVMVSDKIVYIWADVNDVFVRTRLLDIHNFPELLKLVNECGKNQRERIAFCVKNLCLESAKTGRISFSDCEAARKMSLIKKVMYEIYDLVDLQNSAEILERVYEFLTKTKIAKDIDPALVLALMTDNDAMSLSSKTIINAEDFYKCSVAELLPHLKGRNIDFTDPDLDW